MATPIKLTYFDVTALGEPVRLLLAYGQFEFEDERLNETQFGARKQTFPYGKVPVLEIEGRTLHQSIAICRFLARKVRLVGDGEWDALEADIQVDTLGDLRAAMAAYAYEEHEGAKAQKREVLMGTTVPYYVGKLEAHLEKNGGHFVNGKLTWADLWFAGMYDYFNHLGETDIFANSPKLKALKEKVFALQHLQKYLTNRPAAEY